MDGGAKTHIPTQLQGLDVMLCALSEEEYTKVHNFRSAKQIWDTLVVTYEGTSQVKRNKLSLLTRKYKLFSMEEGEDIQSMFRCFQTILNELRSLGITDDNYDHIDKIFEKFIYKVETTGNNAKNIKES